MATKPKQGERVFFTEGDTALPIPDLTAHQKYSWADFVKNGLREVFAESGIDVDKLLDGDNSVLDNIKLTDEQVAALKNYRDALYDSSTALDTFYDDIMSRVNDSFEKMNEEAEESISKI